MGVIAHEADTLFVVAQCEREPAERGAGCVKTRGDDGLEQGYSPPFLPTSIAA